MKQIGNIINQIDSYKSEPRINIEASKREFADWMVKKGSVLIKRQYVIDEQNKLAMSEIFKYCTADESFKGDLSKGLLFVGGVGTGKTTLAILIMKLYSMHTKKIPQFLNTASIHELYKTNELINNPCRNIETAPLILDELGREQDKINIFGTIHHPVEELMQKRYLTNPFTIATSNFNFESLKEKYSEYITDRMREMMNVIILDGKSRRK